MSALAELAVETFQPIQRPDLRVVEATAQTDELLLADGRIVVDLADGSIFKDGECVELSRPKQFELAVILGQPPDSPKSCGELADRLGQDEYPTSYAAVRQYTVGLRKNLGDIGHLAIRTINKNGIVGLSTLDPDRMMEPTKGDEVDYSSDGLVEVNHTKGITRVNGRWVEKISLKEFIALAVLARNQGKYVDTRTLSLAVFGYENEGSSIIESSYTSTRQVISRLRKTLGKLGDPKQGVIENANGWRSYRLV